MAGWVLLSFVPVIVGLFAAARCRPQNKGKKKALKAFTIAYPQQIISCVMITAVAMVGVVALTHYLAPEVLTACSGYYVVYAILIGVVVGLAIMLARRSISFMDDKITVSKGFLAKPAKFSTAELVHLDIQKTAVRALKEDGTVMFSAGMMMENLDLFFAWTHERPAIKLTMNGKELPKKGPAKPQQPGRKPN